MEVTRLITPVVRQTLSGDAYKQLSELLMSGRVMPGEQLSLRSLATSLGVSVMPVREAVSRLLSEKALELLPNRTLKVPTMSVSQFREITDIRINLEGYATAKAATLVNEEGLIAIQAAQDRFVREISYKRPDVSQLVSLNKELHFAIYRQANMPMLLEMIESLWLRIGPIVNYDFRSESARVTEHVSAEHHDRIIKALKKGDATGASEALTGDIQGAAEFIISAGVLLSEDPQKSEEVIEASQKKRVKSSRRSALHISN